jgi:hypothetical protein
MPWTWLLEGLGPEWRKPKISSQEEPDTSNGWEAAKKEDTPGDLSRRTVQGKSSHVSIAGNLVISHEIANRNDMAIRGLSAPTKDQHATTQCHYTLGKPTKKQEELYEVSLTTEV